MEYSKEEFSMYNFIKGYKVDLDYIFRSLKDQKIEDIIDVVSIDTLKVVDKRNLNYKSIIEIIKSKKYMVFFMLGSIADENETYYRFIDGVQYRIKEGKCYEESSEYFNEYKLNEEILDLNGFNISIEDAIGLLVYEKERKYFFELCKINSDTEKIEWLKNIGEFNWLCKKYLDKYMI